MPPPAHAAEDGPAVCPTERTGGPAAADRILVVEDHAATRMLLERILSKAGYEVTCAADGEEALEEFGKTFFPVVITDWMMPGMSGIDLCRHMRKQELPGYVFIIILTAKDAQADIVEGVRAGADEYLTKPFSRAELLARLTTAKRIHALESSLKQKTEEVRRLSITDPLTGAYNRVYLGELLPSEVKRSLRYRHPLSVILCDIDHFKAINDSHGHRAGDAVLREFVACIRNSVRDGVDWVARYGGEEFVVVLPETPLPSALIVAERLRTAVWALSVAVGEKRLSVTASFGVAALGDAELPHAEAAELLIESADRCMYEAKRLGRDRVVSS
jgi:diguanylate cyclase (GGDEF)-like protein